MEKEKCPNCKAENSFWVQKDNPNNNYDDTYHCDNCGGF